MAQLPPRAVRRLVIAPVVFVGALVATLLAPLVHLGAAVVDTAFDRRRWRCTRLVGIGLALCAGEAFGLFALFTVWVGSGFGRYMRRPFWVRANNVLAGQYMAMVTNAIQFFVGFRFVATFDREPVGPQLVFARHVGPGDVFRLMKIVFRDLGHRCHAVGAAKLQWDPFLDIAGERLGFHYLCAPGADPAQELDAIRRLTAGMGADETLILCPEGGNFTPRRRAVGIDRERTRGREDRAELAASLKHTLLPRSGGVMAAIDGAPHANVVFLGHAGLDDITSLGSLWRAMPLRRTVIARGWTVPVDDLPDDRTGRSRWLHDQWRRVDDWIDEELAAHPV
jgi:1-acyl-sn-glycerol-3-phosphate acyltransferase